METRASRVPRALGAAAFGTGRRGFQRFFRVVAARPSRVAADGRTPREVGAVLVETPLLEVETALEPDDRSDAGLDPAPDPGADLAREPEADRRLGLAPDLAPDLVAPDLAPDLVPGLVPELVPGVVPDLEPDLELDLDPDFEFERRLPEISTIPAPSTPSADVDFGETVGSTTAPTARRAPRFRVTGVTTESARNSCPSRRRLPASMTAFARCRSARSSAKSSGPSHPSS
jgi:hypothetical protein